MKLSPGQPAPPFVREPVSGVPVDVGKLGERALVLVFLRYAGSAHTRRTLLDLEAVWPELDKAKVAVVAVTEGSLASARDVVPRMHVLFPVVFDDGALYDAYGVGRDKGFVRTLLSPAGLAALPTTLATGHGAISGPLDRTMAAFVVRGGQIASSWYGRAITDRPDVQELVRVALSG